MFSLASSFYVKTEPLELAHPRIKLTHLNVFRKLSHGICFHFQDVSSVRELEDLIIEGTNSNVIKGKLDQKASHFEVDFAMGVHALGTIPTVFIFDPIFAQLSFVQLLSGIILKIYLYRGFLM